MKPQHMASLSLLVALTLCLSPAPACTGLRLIAEDGTVVFGRTQEWGTFDLKSRVVIIPRNHALATKLPDGKQGVS